MIEFTEEEKAIIQEVSERFTEFLNQLIREGKFYIFTIPDMLAAVYLRMRMYMDAQRAQSYLFNTVLVAEDRIQSGSINAHLTDGTPVVYSAVEEGDDTPTVNKLLAYGEYEVTDEDIEKFLADQ